jgi:hypothetical protein
MMQIVQLLITFPKLLELFLKIDDLVEKEILRRRYVASSARIRDWVRNGAPKQN